MNKDLLNKRKERLSIQDFQEYQDMEKSLSNEEKQQACEQEYTNFIESINFLSSCKNQGKKIYWPKLSKPVECIISIPKRIPIVGKLFRNTNKTKEQLLKEINEAHKKMTNSPKRTAPNTRTSWNPHDRTDGIPPRPTTGHSIENDTYKSKTEEELNKRMESGEL